MVARQVLNVVGHSGTATPSYTLLNTELGADVVIGNGSTIEFSVLGAGAAVGERCLISGTTLPDGAVIPDNTFIQTWALSDGKPTAATSYAAQIISTGDDIKKDGGLDGEAPPPSAVPASCRSHQTHRVTHQACPAPSMPAACLQPADSDQPFGLRRLQVDGSPDGQGVRGARPGLCHALDGGGQGAEPLGGKDLPGTFEDTSWRTFRVATQVAAR